MLAAVAAAILLTVLVIRAPWRSAGERSATAPPGRTEVSGAEIRLKPDPAYEAVARLKANPASEGGTRQQPGPRYEGSQSAGGADTGGTVPASELVPAPIQIESLGVEAMDSIDLAPLSVDAMESLDVPGLDIAPLEVPAVAE
jgi:hypothetical protein